MTNAQRKSDTSGGIIRRKEVKKMGNAYLDKQRKMQQDFFEAGEQIGLQKAWDYIQIALRDPDAMGKDVLGRKRIERVYAKMMELVDVYHTAFTDDKEADYWQEKLDAQLREIWDKDLATFYERYPTLKKLDYNKPRKNWV